LTTEIDEDALRDMLAPRLDILGDGLTLLDTEKYIPNSLGTRSFIDILAKDSRDRWVLVELKRSDAAAREAIHEIYKYVEGVKAHLGARDDEIRAMVVSTEWKELLVPFSRFVHDSDISVSGHKLIVGADNTLVGSEPIEPLPMTSGRVLSPWHEISLYKSEQRLIEGIASYDVMCKAKHIDDYVMVELEAPPGFYEASLIAVARSINNIHGIAAEPTPEQIADMRSKMDQLDNMIYFVPQLQSAEDYLEVIKTNAETYEEVKEWMDDTEGDELLSSLQEYALDLEPRPDRDYLEIGYPAKFRSKILQSEGWTIKKVHRRGAFARNGVLSDETILGEIGGDAGTSGQRLKRTILLSDKAEFAQLSKDVGECLVNNPAWQASIRDQMLEAHAEFPDAQLDVSIFVPTTGVLTLFFAMQEEGIFYVPNYSLGVREGDNVRCMYVGELNSEDEVERGPQTFLDVIAKHYDGELGMLVMAMTSGGYEPADMEVLEDLGLFYDTFRCDAEGDERTFFRRKNGKWRQVDAIQSFGAFGDYMQRNQRLLRTIDAKLSPRIGNGMCDGSSAIKQLEPLVDEATVIRSRYHPDVPEACDLCLVPVPGETFFSDGQVRDHTAWANMCADCTVYHGAGIGWGIGQLYRKQADGRWLCVAGGRDEPEDNDE
jgi:hypothetical protein